LTENLADTVDTANKCTGMQEKVVCSIYFIVQQYMNAKMTG